MSVAPDTIAGARREATDLMRVFHSRRRVSDKVMQAFDYACVMCDVETATMLMAILDNLANRDFGQAERRQRLAYSGLDVAAERLRSLQAVSDGIEHQPSVGSRTLP